MYSGSTKMKHWSQTGLENLQGTALVNHASQSNVLKFTLLLRIFSKRKLVRKCLLKIYSKFTRAELFQSVITITLHFYRNYPWVFSCKGLFSRLWLWQEAHLSSLLLFTVECLRQVVFYFICFLLLNFILVWFTMSFFLAFSLYRWHFADLTEIFYELTTLTSSFAILSSSLQEYKITEFITSNICF